MYKHVYKYKICGYIIYEYMVNVGVKSVMDGIDLR